MALFISRPPGCNSALNAQTGRAALLNSIDFNVVVRDYRHSASVDEVYGQRGIVGIYHNVSPKHLHRYCNEFGFRYNDRLVTDPQRFVSSFTQIHTRLTYKQLIAK